MSIGTSASVLALGCLAAFLAPAGSYAADADTSNEEQYQESVWHLRVRQFWRWQVHEHRELDTGRLLLDAGQLTDPGRPRSFRPGSCDPSSGPCPQVVPVPPVGMEQAHSVRPPDTETYDGRDDTSGRVILLAVLVAIGFLVLICVVIGLYCTWLHLHYSGCDTEGVYKSSATGASKEVTALATAQPKHPFPQTQHLSANNSAFISQSTMSASHGPSMPQGYPPTASTAQNVCQNCGCSAFDMSNRCPACPYSSSSTCGATGGWSHQQQAQASAWQQHNNPPAQLQPIPQGQIVQEQRAAQLPAASPQLLHRSGSPVSSIQSQSTQGAAPSNPTMGSMMDRELYPPTPSGGTQATSMHAYPHSQPSSLPMYRSPMNQQDSMMSSLPSGMDLGPLSGPASGPAPGHPGSMASGPPIGQPGSLIKAASTPESVFKPRNQVPQSYQNTVPYKLNHASEGPSQPSSQGALHRPSSLGSQATHTQGKNGTITSFPNGGISSRGNSYGNSQHSPGSHASSPKWGKNWVPQPIPPIKIKSSHHWCNSNDAAVVLQAAGGSIMSSGYSTEKMMMLSQHIPPVATLPGSSYGSVPPAGRSGTSTPGNGHLTPAHFASLEGSEPGAALSPCVSKNGLSSLAPTADTVEQESRVRTDVADVLPAYLPDDTDSVPISSTPAPTQHRHQYTSTTARTQPQPPPQQQQEQQRMSIITHVTHKVPASPPFRGMIDTGLVLGKTAQVHSQAFNEMFDNDIDEADTAAYLSNDISGDTMAGYGENSRHTGRTRHIYLGDDHCRMQLPRRKDTQNSGAHIRASIDNTSSAHTVSRAVSRAVCAAAAGRERDDTGSRTPELEEWEGASKDGRQASGCGDNAREVNADTPLDSAAIAAANKMEPGVAEEPPLVHVDDFPVPNRSNPSANSPLTIMKQKSMQLTSDSNHSVTTSGTTTKRSPSGHPTTTPAFAQSPPAADAAHSSGMHGSTSAMVPVDTVGTPREQHELSMLETHAAAVNANANVLRERSRTSSMSHRPASQTTLTGELGGYGRRGPYDLISPTTSSAVPTGSGSDKVPRRTDTNTNAVLEVSNPIDELRAMHGNDVHEDDMHEDGYSGTPMFSIGPSSARGASLPGGLSVGGFSGVSALGDIVAEQVLGDLNTAESADIMAAQASQPSQLSSLGLLQSHLYVQTFMRGARTSQDSASQVHANEGVSHSSVRASDYAMVGCSGSVSSVSGLACPVVAPTAEGLQSRAREFASNACSDTISADACITRIVHPATSCAVDVVGATGIIDEELPTSVDAAAPEPPTATAHDMHGPHACAHGPFDYAAAENLDIDMELDAGGDSSPTSNSQKLPPPPSMTSALLTDSGPVSVAPTPVATLHTMQHNAVYGVSTTSTPGTTERLPVRGTPAATFHSSTTPSVPTNACTTDAEVDADTQVPEVCTSDLEQHACTPPNVPLPPLQSFGSAINASNACNVKSTPNSAARPAGLPPRPGTVVPPRTSEPGVTPPSPAALQRTIMHPKGPDAALTVSLEALDNSSALGVSPQEVESLLDTLESTKTRISGRFTLLGLMHRRVSGQGVVEFAVGPIAPREPSGSFQKRDKHMHETQSVDYDDIAEEDSVAIKFYIVHAAFDRVASLWSQPPIRRLMTALVDVIPQGPHMDVPVLPPSSKPPGSGPEDGQEGPQEPQVWKQIEMLPMVVMKRGTTLDEWARREKPSLPMILTALVDMCEHLRELHACGYVYYALKPSNVVWLEEDRKWHLADFGCASRSGVHAGLSFSLNYAAPELIAAQALGSRTILSDPSADIWAVGVTAYELLLGKTAWDMGTSPQVIKAALLGQTYLPWEKPSEQVPGGRLSSLPNLHTSIMHCLCRMAERRPSADQMALMFFNLLEYSSRKHTVVHPS